MPGKGRILTQLSLFWFELLKDVVGNHLITADVAQMPASVQAYADQLRGRSMLVKRLSILKIEAIVRGYISGSGWSEYKSKGTVCDIQLPAGLRESDRLAEPLFTPSTKADIGEHDLNIHPSKGTTLFLDDERKEYLNLFLFVFFLFFHLCSFVFICFHFD